MRLQAKTKGPAGPAPVSRRDMLRISAVFAGGAMVVGVASPSVLAQAASSAFPPTDFGPFGPFVRFDADGKITVVSRHHEMGQGSTTALAALVAEELDADWSTVSVVHCPSVNKVYAHPEMRLEGAGLEDRPLAILTGGSSSITASGEQYRRTGAAAREMFVTAAAKKWGVSADEIQIKNSVVSHASGHPIGKSATFAELLPSAAKIDPPQNPTLKDPKSFNLVGTDRLRRKDSRAIVTGTNTYTQDVRKPDMLYAVVAHAPKFGASVRSFDATAAKATPGVVDVFALSEPPLGSKAGVAVVAKSTWAAMQGRRALKVEWNDEKAENRSSEEILARVRDLAAGKAEPSGKLEYGVVEKWHVFKQQGSGGPPEGAKIFEATYDFPYLAHAPMEPLNCVAEVDGSRVRLTFAAQAPGLDQINIGRLLGINKDSIEIVILPAGGSFGRRASYHSDYPQEAVKIAKHIGGGRPVKLVWTREDDMTAGLYRPLAHIALKVALGADGYPVYWRHRVVSQAHHENGEELDPSATGTTGSHPYLKPTAVIDAQALHPAIGVRGQWWRSVEASYGIYVMEHTVELLARAAGKDPIEYRRELYRRSNDELSKRYMAALNLVLERAGPNTTPGWTRGMAVSEFANTVVAAVAEVKLENGKPRVGKVFQVVDVGPVVFPSQVINSIEGATIFGLSAGLYGQITLKDGVVEQTNWDGYPVLRMNEAPEMDTYLMPSTEPRPRSGAGEPGVPAITPAVANALLAITGKPIFSLPIVKT